MSRVVENWHERVAKIRLKLFLSVDIVGSTAFKNQKLRDSSVAPWLPTFQSFYIDLPTLLQSRYVRDDLQCPSLWKAIGDELVFVTDISNHLEVGTHIEKLKDALVSYRKELRLISKKLDLKSTAWIANFPVSNSVVRIPSSTSDSNRRPGSSSFVEDYIGPSIDAGFRLSKYASPRKMVLSLGLAYLLARGITPKVKLFLTESHAMKGVLGGERYPVFWTNMFDRASNHHEILEDILASRNPERCHHDNVIDYFESYVQNFDGDELIPLIPGDEVFGNEPEAHAAARRKLEQFWRKEIQPGDEPKSPQPQTLDVQLFDRKLRGATKKSPKKKSPKKKSPKKKSPKN